MRKLIAEGEIVMDLIKENENLIHCLKELRDELKIEEPLKPGKCLILEKKVAVCD